MTITRQTRVVIPAVALFMAAGCETTTMTPAAGPTSRPAVAAIPAGMGVARRIEAAHGKDAWTEKQAVACDIMVNYGGAKMLAGSMTYETGRGRVRIVTDGGATLVFDGERAWVSPSAAQVPMIRFQLLTWPYFLAAPFKLRDPGTYLAPHGRRPLDGVTHVTALLTFDAGTGDSPDDWYVIYQDPATDRLAAVAYIVTYGTTVDEAQKEPHALVYEDYRTIDGVALATRWVMYNWSLSEGAHGEPLGDVTLTNIRFVEPDERAFERPVDAREDPLPSE